MWDLGIAAGSAQVAKDLPTVCNGHTVEAGDKEVEDELGA